MIVLAGLIKSGDGNRGDAVTGNKIFGEDRIGFVRYVCVRIDLKITAMGRKGLKTGVGHELLKLIPFFLHEAGQ